MAPSLQLFDTATITQHHRMFKGFGPFHEEHILLKTQTRIRALQARWKQAKNLPEAEVVFLWNDTRKELFPCGCGNSQEGIRRISKTPATHNLFTESLQS